MWHDAKFAVFAFIFWFLPSSANRAFAADGGEKKGKSKDLNGSSRVCKNSLRMKKAHNLHKYWMRRLLPARTAFFTFTLWECRLLSDED
jgi:hypothetical protein